MPTPASRRVRHVLTAALAVGVIGVGYAGIASARSSSDEADSRLTAAAPRDAVPESVPDPEPSLPVPSATTSSAPRRPSPKASASASARPTRTAAKPTRKPASKRPTKAPTKAPKPPAPDRTTSAPSSGGSATVREIIRLVNAERKDAGCGTLAGETRLHRAAQKHSERQAKQNTMSHELPGEAAMGDRVTAEGYRWGGVAENVAAGYRTPAAVMTGWMNSAGHKANILNCGYEHIGVGLAKSGDGTPYWTQNFASPR